tara:strand:+ start:56 stop:268 length:213 start_codon:yes stop_codon:yes gene_type:complete
MRIRTKKLARVVIPSFLRKWAELSENHEAEFKEEKDKVDAEKILAMINQGERKNYMTYNRSCEHVINYYD